VSEYSVLELCAGGGGQALGLEASGFVHAAALEIEPVACETLRLNRPQWCVIEDDIANLDGRRFRGLDLLAAGLPCPPFSIAGKQLGIKDERNLFPHALRIIRQVMPRAILLENVPGFASQKFTIYRQEVIDSLKQLGYHIYWQILNAADFGVPQLRPRFVLVGFRTKCVFTWPTPFVGNAMTVSKAVKDLMGKRHWLGLEDWAVYADKVAPTLVGGSKKHGGPDLGPTRAKRQWESLHIDGHGLADTPPDTDFAVDKFPKLTVQMASRLQSFPDSWKFAGKKTTMYRQIGNAFPPPVAQAVGKQIIMALSGTTSARTHFAFEQNPLFHEKIDNVTMTEQPKKTKREGSKEKIRRFLLANLGRIIGAKEIQQASGNVSEWARRVRELRDEEGYQILTHKDRAELKPGQYLIETDKRQPALPRNISKETRAFVLERNGYTCQMCGLAAGDVDPFNPDRTVQLAMGHIIDKSKGGSDTPENLRAICTNCNEGLQNTAPPKPDRIWLLSQVRRATVDDQLEILKWLEQKYAKLRSNDKSSKNPAER
jgi:DNA (cytosine-5)-methyltransferase 1